MKDRVPIESPMHDEFWRLAQAYCANTQNADERDRLEAMLWASTELQDQYIDYLNLHAELCCEFRSFDGVIQNDEAVTPRATSKNRIARLATAKTKAEDIAVGSKPAQCGGNLRRPPTSNSEWHRGWMQWTIGLAAATVLLAVWLARSNAPSDESFVAVRGFATLTKTAECLWAEESVAFYPGHRVGPEGIELAKGLAEIEFDCGARVILEGPAQLVVRGSNRALLARGKLAAYVPPRAVGFKVDTPLATITDLGTEFGLAVESDGVTEAHVMKGIVQVASLISAGGSDESVRLTSGQAGRVELDGVLSQQTRSRATAFTRSMPFDKNARSMVISTSRGHGADSFIRSGEPLANFGGDRLLRTKATNFAGDRRKIWLRFDLSDGKQRLSQLTSATLRLALVNDDYGSSAQPTKVWEFEVWGLKDARHGVPWDELPTLCGWVEGFGRSFNNYAVNWSPGITWGNTGGNNARGEGVHSYFFQWLGRFQVVGPSRDGEKVEFSTTALREFIVDDSNGLITFAVLRTTPQPHKKEEDAIHCFASKEHGILPGPQLLFEFRPDDLSR